MNGVRRHVQELERPTDVARVVALLRRDGPMTLPMLGNEPELLGWSAERVQAAVTAAWARTLIFIDARDRLVAL